MSVARLDRTLLTLTTMGLLVALVAGCAGASKSAKPSTEVVDGAGPAAPPAAPATPPAAEPAPAATCSLSRVQFDFDSAGLEAPARQALKDAATCLSQRRPAEVVVEGHCDERGTAAYNIALGNKRASAVAAYLAELGVTAPLQAISFGEELPLVPGAGEEAWSQNRRAELKLPGERRTDGNVVAGR